MADCGNRFARFGLPSRTWPRGRYSDPSDGAEAKFDMSKWLFGAIGLQTAIILGPVVALGR
jgi:hypothetical protein